MSKKTIKMPYEIAKEKILQQYDLGIELANSGVEQINKGRGSQRDAVDSFKTKYDHWQTMTIEILDEIFVSKDYSYNFSHKRSSKIEYVNSSWQADIKYYLHKEIKQKIEYIKMLADSILSFDEVQDNTQENGNINMPDKLDDLSVKQIIEIMKPRQLVVLSTVLVTMICGAFYLGLEVRGWVYDKEKYDLVEQNDILKKDNNKLNTELSSLKDKQKSSDTQ